MMWLKVVALLIALATLTGAAYLAGSNEKDEEWSLKWAERDKADLAANLKHEKELRDQEQVYVKKLNEANENGEKLQEELERTVAVGADITDRLQHEYDKLAAKSKLCQGSPTSDGGKNAQAPADMLAQLLSRSEQRSTEIARYADELGIALGVCQAAYEGISNKDNK